MSDIHNRLCDLLTTKFRLDSNKLANNWETLSLTGPDIRFSSVDLVYLTFEIEKLFEIHFDFDDFRNYSFCNPSSIERAILKHLKPSL